MADAADLKSAAARRGGSSPSPGTSHAVDAPGAVTMAEYHFVTEREIEEPIEAVWAAIADR